MSETQRCPICLAEVFYFPRYPKYVCSSCFDKAADENNRPLDFSNESIGGGFIAFYKDTRETRDSHICYIDGIKCRADEHYFGGIVIQPYDRE